ncbi:tetratricopeptide repeat protein [Hyphomonas sp.]|uniref:tetratricopeptide repeat protein n=1 Tax=Hyphomonas sp. TaxID=87 RepID=UPI0025B7B83C|nr:tetratricopeptide repeat protein [Hyphomonas sp.]MBI1398758.1 tetratricopeptide repeat protein [Hyphomonas sp.]
MKRFRVLLALAPLSISAACATGTFGRTAYPSADRPDEARAYSDFMVARVAALTNDPEMAARHYASAISTAPEELDLAERAVFSALLAGDYGLAAGMARRASDSGSEASLVRLTLIADSIGRGKTKAAIDLVEASDLSAFNRMVARNMEAWCLLDVEGADAAEALLQKNLTGDPRLDNATLHILGLVQTAAHKDDAALATFDAIWASGARLATGTETYAALLAERGEREKALSILNRFRADVGYNAALEALKARIEAGEAIKAPRLTVRQGAALALFLPASALFFQTSDDVAAVYFVLAVALDPDLHQARTLWAQSLIQADRRDEAIRILRDVPQSSPYYAAARSQMASTLLQEERANEALQVAAEALAAKPDRSLRLQLADLYRALERYGESEAILTDVIAADEAEGREDWRPIFSRGAARERQGNYEGAEADLKRALAINPSNATVLNYLGYSWIDRGVNLADGLDLIRQAVALQPDSAHIVDSLGWAHYKFGQYDLAVDYLERAVELMPGDAVLNDHLGDAYWQVGRRKEAGFQWRRALKLDPAPEDKAKIEQKLMTGPGAPPPAPGSAVAR